MEPSVGGSRKVTFLFSVVFGHTRGVFEHRGVKQTR